MGLSKSQAAANAGLDLAAPKPEGESSIGKALQVRAGYGKVTADAIEKYLAALRECGIMARAALAANLSYSSIRNLRQRDPEFADMEEEAKQLWIAEKIDAPFQKWGLEGVHKVLLNQKTGETVLGEKVIQPQIALAFARKFDPAYRDKQELDVKHSGGVLVVAAPAQTAEEWHKKFSQPPAEDVIDTTAKEV